MQRMDQVEQFIGHFERQLSKIERAEDRTFRKILIVTLLGALARGRYPQERSDRRAFTSLIIDHSGWSDALLVTFPQLKLQIDWRTAKGEITGLNSDFRERLDARHAEWQRSLSFSEIRRSRLDPRADDLRSTAPTRHEDRLLSSCNHANLLYDYRSTLVHEFREPGYPSEMIPDGTSPYYVGTTTIDSDEQVYELVYPVQFLVSLVRDTILSLKSHYLENRIDPYAGYRFGSLWNQVRQ
jgi:hypothetical protein